MDIESSYGHHELGKTLYNLVLDRKPNKIVEFGVLHGYSTVWMALALRELGRGRIYSYDLWEDYQYSHGCLDTTKENLARHGVEDYVELGKMEFCEWLSSPIPIDVDMVHIDIGNDGDTILRAYHALEETIDAGAVMVFEGGTEERDGVEWMDRYGKKPICSVKDEVGYRVVDSLFPAISIIER